MVFQPATATAINILQWISVAAVFGYVFRNVRLRFAIPFAYLTIIVVNALVQVSAHLLGYGFISGLAL